MLSVPEYVGRAEQLGARVIIPPQTLPQGEVLAILQDPQGIPFRADVSRAVRRSPSGIGAPSVE